jgi:hypothetical protein
MSVQTRTTAVQDEVVRLYANFVYDGRLLNPDSQPVVEILDRDGETVLDTVIATVENTGIYYADWYIPKYLPLGEYYDRWTYQWMASNSVQEKTLIFSVNELSSIINHLSDKNFVSMSNRARQLVTSLNDDFILEAQHIPVYFEQGMRVQQDNQVKKQQHYYNFTVNNNEFSAFEGDVYTISNRRFTVFKDLENNIDLNGDVGSSSEIDSESETIVLVTVGGLDPDLSTGELTKLSGDGSNTIHFQLFEKRVQPPTSVYNFAYENWNKYPRPIVRVNNRIEDGGWYADYQGRVYFDKLKSPEDSIATAYNFKYFSDKELLSFLDFGLKMMNGLPPASEHYVSLDRSPRLWDPGILAYAAVMALRRLIFGLSWQERRIIYGTPDDAQRAMQNFQDLYKSYQEVFDEFGKNVKTRKLPSMSQLVVPEYTLPGGRSRFFRYMFKSN